MVHPTKYFWSGLIIFRLAIIKWTAPGLYPCVYFWPMLALCFFVPNLSCFCLLLNKLPFTLSSFCNRIYPLYFCLLFEPSIPFLIVTVTVGYTKSPYFLPSTHIFFSHRISYLWLPFPRYYTPATKLGAYTGITMSDRPSVRLYTRS